MRLEPRRERGEHAHWQVSYIDLLTAMIAAFTLLLAISKPDQAKLDVFASAVDTKNKHTQENLTTIAQQLRESIKADSSLKNQVNVVLTNDGVEVRFLTSLLFPIGRAKLQTEGYDAIFKLAPNLKRFTEARNAYLSIEGHTDDQPIINGKEFKTNWELSSARAIEVLRFLEDSTHFQSHRLSSVGYADARPQNSEKDNTTGTFTEIARAQNRRVVIKIYYWDEGSVMKNPSDEKKR
jgi:chemotaxis protein MotB